MENGVFVTGSGAAAPDQATPMPLPVPATMPGEARSHAFARPATAHHSAPEIHAATGVAALGSALILSHGDKSSTVLRGHMAGLGFHVREAASDEVTTDWLARQPVRFGVCILDADFMGDEGETLDLCLRLRQADPQVRILLIDVNPTAQDTTAEAMGLCDGRLSPMAAVAEVTTVLQAALLRQAVNRARPDVAPPSPVIVAALWQKTSLGLNHPDLNDGPGLGPWLLPLIGLGAFAWFGIALVIRALI